MRADGGTSPYNRNGKYCDCVHIGWLVQYTTGFMFARRSREFGTYVLIGLENNQVARLFFWKIWRWEPSVLCLGFFREI